MPEQYLLRKTCRFQLRPTRRQIRLLESALALCCEIYNAALQERIGAWKRERKTVSCYDQTLELTEVRRLRPDIASLPVDLAREPLRRVQRAYQVFFRRLKAGDRPGFPRFRSQNRYNSLALSSFRSRNRSNAREQLRRAHQRLANLRNICHHISRWLVSTFDLIAFEDLRIRAMTRGQLAKAIMAAASRILLHQIRYKAAEARAWAVRVDPRGTSLICSGCGQNSWLPKLRPGLES